MMRFTDGVYVSVESRRDRQVARTAELGNGDVSVDYDSAGNVIGVEFLEVAVIEYDTAKVGDAAVEAAKRATAPHAVSPFVGPGRYALHGAREALAPIRDLALTWAAQTTDHHDDTEQQIADGHELLAMLGEVCPCGRCNTPTGSGGQR